MQPLMKLEGIRKTYPMRGGDVHALKDISLQFEPGEFCSIVGTSGSGKSTLLYLLGLLTEPSDGSFVFSDQDVAKLPDLDRSRLRGREIGFIFQSFHLVPQLTIQKNVMLASRYAESNGNGKLQTRASELIERVGLGHRLRHRPIELSNGEMQRVAIARALLMSPSVILADEPTGNLDEENGNHIFSLMEDLHREGKTIIMVTHDLQLAARTPRQIRLKDGEVIHESN